MKTLTRHKLKFPLLLAIALWFSSCEKYDADDLILDRGMTAVHIGDELNEPNFIGFGNSIINYQATDVMVNHNDSTVGSMEVVEINNYLIVSVESGYQTKFTDSWLYVGETPPTDLAREDFPNFNHNDRRKYTYVFDIRNMDDEATLFISFAGLLVDIDEDTDGLIINGGTEFGPERLRYMPFVR